LKKIPLLILSIIFFSSIACFSIQSNVIEDNYQTEYLKNSAPLSYNIHIDGNWTYTEGNYSWCTGAGTSGNPYVIQDIEIDANGGYGILIGNTTEYFRIENVSIYNGGSGADNSALIMKNVDNGHLLSNYFSDNSYYGVYIYDCNDFVLEYNFIEDNGNTGIRFDGNNGIRSTNFQIQHNFIKGNNQYGLYFYYSDWCEVWNNTFSGVGSQNQGLYVGHSEDNTIYENHFSSHSSSALYLIVDHRTNVTKNTISNNGNGIYCFLSQDSDLLYNNITDSSTYGIYFTAADSMWVEGNRIIGCQRGLGVGINSDYNTFTKNIFQDCTSYGIYIPYDTDYDNTHFDFYKNSFISNNIQVLDNSLFTNWNNSEFGNYWDTYSGIDINCDGIGDSPYVLNVNVTDYRPLMVANFSLLGDTDLDGISDYAELNGGLNPFGSEPTDPFNSDSDGDTLDDYEEIFGYGNTYNGNPTNPNDSDTDGDGIDDLAEITGSGNTYDGNPLDPTDSDTDGDGIDDYEEISGTGNQYNLVPTDPLLADTDGDGLDDGEECTGAGNLYNFLPTNPLLEDTDGDGIDDLAEITGSANLFSLLTATNPNAQDSDLDGFTDLEEISGDSNSFNHLPLDPNSLDSDGDGYNGYDEIPLGNNPLNPSNYPKPDLVILPEYVLEGDFIIFYVMNQGNWTATDVTVIVEIETITGTIFNKTFNLDVNETKEIRILKDNFRDRLQLGEDYSLSVSIDPNSVIEEEIEGNNTLDGILYSYSISEAWGITPLLLVLIIAGSTISLIALGVGTFLLLRRKKQEREFKPIQVMVLEKFGSTLLYNHNFQESDLKLGLNGKQKEKNLDTEGAEESKSKEGVDETLAAGAFSGIQSLLKTILRTEKGINEISHGEYTIYFNYGEKIICVLISYGKFHPILHKLHDFSKEFEQTFENELKEFDGRVDIFSRASLIVGKYLAN
jgi:parallel beta-helix repeat protein